MSKKRKAFLSKKQTLSFAGGKSKTVRSAAHDTDINKMLKGQVPLTSARRSFYIDETIFPETYEDCFNLVADAQDAFMRLDPEVRQIFRNDPARLAQALADPDKQDWLRQIGVLPPLESKKAAKRPSAASHEAAPAEGDNAEGVQGAEDD